MHCMKLRWCFKELIVSSRRKLNNIEIIFLLEDCVIMDNIMLTQLEIIYVLEIRRNLFLP